MFSGELTHVNDIRFRDLDKLDIVGIYPDYEAPIVWRAAATHSGQRSDALFHCSLRKLMRPQRLHMQSAFVDIKRRLFDRLGKRRMGMAGARNIFGAGENSMASAASAIMSPACA